MWIREDSHDLCVSEDGLPGNTRCPDEDQGRSQSRSGIRERGVSGCSLVTKRVHGCYSSLWARLCVACVAQPKAWIETSDVEHLHTVVLRLRVLRGVCV